MDGNETTEREGEQQLTPLVRKARERRGANPEAARRRSRLDVLELKPKRHRVVPARVCVGYR